MKRTELADFVKKVFSVDKLGLVIVAAETARVPVAMAAFRLLSEYATLNSSFSKQLLDHLQLNKKVCFLFLSIMYDAVD